MTKNGPYYIIVKEGCVLGILDEILICYTKKTAKLITDRYGGQIIKVFCNSLGFGGHPYPKIYSIYNYFFYLENDIPLKIKSNNIRDWTRTEKFS